jgi:hypothetical protein
MSLDLTAFDAMLKEFYTDDEVERLTLTDHPLLALIMKMERFVGDSLPVPIIYGNPQGRSATFSEAQGNQSNTAAKKFVLTRARDYLVSTLDGETMDASEGNAGAFLESKKAEFDGSFESISGSLSTALFRSGTGSIGQVGAISTTSLTLLDINDVVNFEVGMTLRSSATDGAANRTGKEVIAAVNRDTGVLTSTSVAWTTVCSAMAANDFLCVSGDLNLKVKGLDAWLPSTVTSTSFFGVDRTTDATRLGGVRLDGSAMPLAEAFTAGAVKVAKWGGKISHYFCSFEQYGNLENELGSKVQYGRANVSAEIGFDTIKIIGPRGTIQVIPDASCQQTIGWGLDMRTWKLYSLGKAPRFLARDGAGNTLRHASQDGEEFRIGYYAQPACRAPGFNVRVTLPSP